MAVLVGGCSSTSCDTNWSCPFRSSSIRRRNKFHRLRLCAMPNCGVFSKRLICSVATCEIVDSDIFTKEEKLPTSIWIQEDEFASESSIEGDCSTLISLIEGDCSTEIEENKPQTNSKRNDIALHFLEERDEKTLSKRLVSLSRSNKTRSARELYSSMEASNLKPDAYACNSFLSCLLRNGSLDDALEMFDKMCRRDMATGHTYTLVLKAIAKNKGYGAAITMFNKLESDDRLKGKFDAIIYNTMISACAKAKDWVKTEKLWRKLGKSSIKGTALTYDLLISIFVQCNCADLAIEAYHESIQFGFESSEATMKAIIATCSQEGNCKLAVIVLRKMLDWGIKPNLISFNSVINCLSKAGHCELAFKVYQYLCSSGLQPDTYTWYALLSALYRSNMYFEVIELFQWIRMKAKVKLDSHVYNVALLACQKQGMWAETLQLLWEMENREMEVPIQSYNHVIFTCEKAGKVEIAFQVYRHMVRQGCNGDDFTYMSLIRCSISVSLWDEFVEILKHIPSYAPVCYSTIHELCSQGKIELAKVIHVKMLKLGLKPDTRISSLMLQHFSD